MTLDITNNMVLLELNVSHALLGDVLDALRHLSQWVNGCTVYDVQGFGRGEQYNTTLERVKGLSRRHSIQMQVASEHASLILAHIKKEFSQADIRYALMPILATGSLANL